ncbi:MAG: cyclopropane-fatty-acyl-phospholipid synthase family protein [Burkholderiaceae bacterium]
MINEYTLGDRAIGLDVSRFPTQARWALRLLARLEHGALDVHFPDGQRAAFGTGRPRAQIRLANWNVFGAALRSGDIGVAESFVAGDWTTPDLVELLALFARNRAAVERFIYGSLWGRLVYRLRHLRNRNTKTNARRNIQAHYDLGNDFYALWLDPTMSYSSALFGTPPRAAIAPSDEATLIAAQRAKYARVLDELRLSRSARILEIGCGWGGFAEIAACAGHAVTGLTLSAAQLDYARARLQRQGLAADLRLQDYRDERAVYDGIASIEMFEAVGEQYWPSYFATLNRCLKPGARACVQTIVIADSLFDRYRTGTDFIQQYIFPGGMLPSAQAFRAQARKAGLKVVAELAFGRDYARTLATWRARFMGQLGAVRALGFDDRFIRLWEFYLAYCEAAFAEGNTDVVQYTLAKA